MAYSNTISIIIAAKDEASKVLDGVAGQVKASSEAMQSAGTKMASVGGSLSKFVTLPIAGIGIAAVKMAGDFQASMTRLVTSAGESNDNLKLVSAGVLQVAKDTGTSTTQLAQALYMIESGGQHGADGLKVLQAAAEGAKAENSDLATVADAVTSVLVDYHLKADDAAMVTSKLVAATSAGKTTFQELAAAMPAILPQASMAHIALNDILGDLAAMTVHGMSAEQASQNLADAIRHMQAPTMQQGKELALLGLTTTQLADDMQNHGLSGTLQEISGRIANLMPPGSNKVILDLKTALSGLSAPVQELGTHLFDGTMTMKDYTKAAQALDPISAKQAMSFATLAGATHRIGDEQMTGAAVLQNYGQALAKAMGDSTGLNVALMLTGENADVANKAIQTVSGASTEAGNHVRGWGEIQQTFNFRLAQFEATLQTTAITVGNDILPALTTFVHHVSDLAGWFERLNPEQKHFLEDLAGIAAVAGPTLLILGKLTTAITSIVKVASLSKAALGVAGLAGGAGEATAAIAGGGGLLAALGPLALGIGAIAAVAGGAYLIFKNLGKAQHDVTQETTGAFAPVSLLTLAQQRQKEALDAVSKATQTQIDKQVQHSQSIRDAQAATQNLKAAQDQVKQALDAFGAQSPQYQLAVQNLSAAEADYNQKLLNEWSLSVDVRGAESDLAGRRRDLTAATHDLSDVQRILNQGLESGVSIAARFGPTAFAQVAGVDTLQQHINLVVAAWNNANFQINSQIPNMVGNLQGLQSNISAAQNQGSNLVTTLQNVAGLQGSISGAGFNPQKGHAMGTNYAPGGLTLVGERGPELVNLPKGSKVYNDKDTSQMMAGGMTVQIFGNIVNETAEAASAFWDRVQKMTDKNQRLAGMGLA